MNFPIVKIHEREIIVREADLEFTTMIGKIIKKYDLTYSEELRILSDRLQSMAKYMIREERHPGEINKPGGLE